MIQQFRRVQSTPGPLLGETSETIILAILGGKMEEKSVSGPKQRHGSLPANVADSPSCSSSGKRKAQNCACWTFRVVLLLCPVQLPGRGRRSNRQMEGGGRSLARIHPPSQHNKKHFRGIFNNSAQSITQKNSLRAISSAVTYILRNSKWKSLLSQPESATNCTNEFLGNSIFGNCVILP